MRFLITGGTGLIGSKLVKKLLEQNHKITVLSRKPSTSVRILLSTSILPIKDLSSIGVNTHFDVIINLSGAPILERRCNNKYKKVLLNSRVSITKELVKLVKRLKTKPKYFISASAIGYYGTNNITSVIDETARCGNGFIASLCSRWEQQAQEMKNLGVHTYILRIPPVLAKNGGMIQKLLPWFSLNLGFIIGNGKQLFPWIHLDDLLDAIEFFYKNNIEDGTYNVVAPEIADNRQFAKALAKRLNKIIFLRIPAFFFKLLLGDSAGILINGQKISSIKLISTGFTFKYDALTVALQDILKK